MSRRPSIKSKVSNRGNLVLKRSLPTQTSQVKPQAQPQSLAPGLQSNRRGSFIADKLEGAAQRTGEIDRKSAKLDQDTYRVTAKGTLNVASKAWRISKPTKKKPSLVNDKPAALPVSSKPKVISARIKRQIHTDRSKMKQPNRRPAINTRGRSIAKLTRLPASSKPKVIHARIKRGIHTDRSKLKQPDRRPAINTRGQAVAKPTRLPAIRSTLATEKKNSASYVSRIQTGRYVNTQSVGSLRQSNFSDFYRSNANVDKNKIHDSGIESIQAARVGYRHSVNTIRSAKNTVVAVRKTGRSARKIYARTKTSVRRVKSAFATARKARGMAASVRATVEAAKRMVMAIKMLANPVVLKVMAIAAAAILIIIIAFSVISTFASVIQGTFGWLYSETKSPQLVYQEYSDEVAVNIDSLNERIQDVMSFPGNSSNTSYRFTKGYRPALMNQPAEYAFWEAGSESNLVQVPFDTLVAMSLVVRNREEKKEYTNADFERALLTVFKNSFTYKERLDTHFDPTHEHFDAEGNLMVCPGHPAIYILAMNENPEYVMQLLDYNQQEKEMYAELKKAVAYFSMPEYPDNILVQGPNATTLVNPGPYLSAISSRYGSRKDPITGTESFHGGVDLVGDASKNEVTFRSPAVAAFDGQVIYAGYNSGRGNYVIIEGTIDTQTFTAIYMHLDLIKATQGKELKAGDVLGFVGNTGRSTGPHLHFELNVNGQRVDPLPYIK
jgi:Peptidase family M23